MRLRGIAVSLIVLALIGTACGGGNGAGNGGGKLTGSVNVDGSSTVFPITQAVAEEFNAGEPDVKVTVGVSGTGGGFKKFCAGLIDIADASRKIKDSEAEACKAKGIEYTELEIAIDGLSVVVHPSNTWATCLTVAELKKAWEPAAQRKVTTWDQIRGGFPKEPIKLFGPGTDSGTFDYFTKEINGEEGKSRSDYQASEDDNTLVTGVAGSKGALGYFGFAYYEQNQSKLKVVDVDSGSGCVKPSRETINGGTYKPLSRPLYIYVEKKALDKAEVVAFVDFFVGNVSPLLKDVGYIELPADRLAATKSEWDTFKA